MARNDFRNRTAIASFPITVADRFWPSRPPKAPSGRSSACAAFRVLRPSARRLRAAGSSWLYHRQLGSGVGCGGISAGSGTGSDHGVGPWHGSLTLRSLLCILLSHCHLDIPGPKPSNNRATLKKKAVIACQDHRAFQARRKCGVLWI